MGKDKKTTTKDRTLRLPLETSRNLDKFKHSYQYNKQTDISYNSLVVSMIDYVLGLDENHTIKELHKLRTKGGS